MTLSILDVELDNDGLSGNSNGSHDHALDDKVLPAVLDHVDYPEYHEFFLPSDFDGILLSIRICYGQLLPDMNQVRTSLTQTLPLFVPPRSMQPFYHSTTADKFIFWGARNRLGLNFGVLIAYVVLSSCSYTNQTLTILYSLRRWTVLSICTTILFEVGWRRVTHKQQGKEREEAARKGQEEVQKKKAEALKERDENVDLVIPE